MNNADKASVCIEIDRSVKTQAHEILTALGFNLTSGITLFFKEVIRLGSLPFDITLDDEEW